MSTREIILANVLKNQPSLSSLPEISVFKGGYDDIVQKYTDTFSGIGGKVFTVDSMQSLKGIIREQFDVSKRMLTTLPELSDTLEMYSATADPHTFEDVELAVIKAQLAVAENGAVWLPEELMGQRIVPFICQHLAVVI